eukprot:5667289-Prymnesium_polylepis.1
MLVVLQHTQPTSRRATLASKGDVWEANHRVDHEEPALALWRQRVPARALLLLAVEAAIDDEPTLLNLISGMHQVRRRLKSL